MAILKNNDNGFRGKIGNTVIYDLNGQVVQREIGEYTDHPTVKQLQARHITRLIAAMLKPVNDFIDIGFKLETKGTVLNSNNIASSVNRARVIKGIYPDLEIDLSLALFSRGSLPVDDKIKAAPKAFGIEFTWDFTLTLPGVKATDQIMVIAYCPERRAAFLQLDGARRKDGIEQLRLPRYQESIHLYTYVTFIASNRESISDSLFTGNFLW